jgi:hypothetical protein
MRRCSKTKPPTRLRTYLKTPAGPAASAVGSRFSDRFLMNRPNGDSARPNAWKSDSCVTSVCHWDEYITGSGQGDANEPYRNEKSPSCRNNWGFLKPGDTYFHAGMHYHRLRKLNCCVRDGNRCDLSDMVAGKTLRRIFRRT